MFPRLAILVVLVSLNSCSGPTSESDTLRTPPNMILELYAPPDNDVQVISTTPDEALLTSTVKSQEWADITFVVLKRDDANWFEVSGSLNPEDGLSARYSENGEEHVSARAPESLDEGLSLLLSYFRDDRRWRQAIAWD